MIVAAVVVTALLVLVLYALALRATLDLTRINADHSVNERDRAYLAIHAMALVLALLAGFGIGRMVARSGVAFAVLLFVVVLVGMTVVLLGSRAMACSWDRNDLLRHWTCGYVTVT
jgi:hypothetical protein